MVMEASHVIGVGWERLVRGEGRGGTGVEGRREIGVVGVLEQHLAVSTRRGGLEVCEGRVVN